ncbi:DUF5686 and carboxypeptidase regulatory-like domain-containing protein [Lacinutrix sp. MedPE-SW]|uniref:DUF5686 and carboxypeptidase regulatory-like domain-containing protein n=1 Tax=Lacinutrix sp. MedPE-SW TaxID=1860087 RepID=UPI00091532D5|nr:DUF5686 and carboxypeptidase regulatory-like domain-containing protein [Lacinutrix sp. MedPE-SW]OIQ16987.1 MAG: hypothetical protein BM549_13025 [Lacinutrix sp. MedPE-SW]
MKKLLLLQLLFFAFNFSFSQISGNVTSNTGETLPFVNVYINNTYTGTTTNEDGNYTLDIETAENYTIVFQYLGYQTLKKTVTINTFPYTLNATLIEENISLSEVVINSDENPANQIIKNTIAKRKDVLEKLSEYKANFYSRGLIKIIDAPEKILGQEVGDLGGGLDSTRSGIIYLSETISKIEYQKPRRLKEKIIASKVSGDSNGFSFNNATDVNYNFYKNTIELENNVISPIADYAFNYYNYKLEGTFYDDNNNLINKILLTPKRDNDPAFSGYIYIVEDQWLIYATDVTITGKRTGIAPVDLLTLKQTFAYSETNNIWALISQTIDFKYGLFGIKGDGRFTAVYSDYDFSPNFDDKHFTREILSFEENSNKKDSLFWKNKRPVPLTAEESSDYVKKDSIQLVKESKPYLDSIDRKNNTFKISDIINGYSYQNSHKNYRFNIDSPLEKITFNTVQGWNGSVGLRYTKQIDEYKRFFNISGNINYGEADNRLRGTIAANYKFNNINDKFISISGGVKVEQFNSSNPISNKENLVSSLFFEDNYIKLYDKSYIQGQYFQELFNGFRLNTSLGFERRKTLVNNTDYVIINEDRDTYTSNNPLNETDFVNKPFKTHNIAKLNVNATISFAQDYLSYPNGKYNIPNRKFPLLSIGYEKGFAATDSNYNFDQFKARLRQRIDAGNKGEFQYNILGGIFSNAENIAFMDYHHFNGNQTHVKINGTYLNAFKNLPYYALSTNNNYAEFHAEHRFNGYILNKIPLVNKLNFNLILGFNSAITQENKPYSEYSVGVDNIGFGKFRFLRVDYVRSYQSGFLNDAVMFGISF